jgi:predicted amidohydrolase YtcJ
MSSSRILVHGGRVFTSDPERPWAEAVVTDGERIVFVGDLAEADDVAGSGAERIDVAGGVVMSGFVDGHAHLLMTGAALLKAQLRTADSLDEIRDRLSEWRAANPTATRVLGISWQFSAVPGGAPTTEMLDDLFPDVPVYLDANDLHSTWVNSAALAELGIDAHTPDPIGGEIVRDPFTGDATGHLQENATVAMVWPLLNRVDDATRDAHLAATLGAYSETGVTTSVDMALDRRALDALRRAEADGTLTMRVMGHWIIHRDDDPARELAQVDEATRRAAECAGHLLRVVGIKIIVDGTIDGCTAAMLEPYTNGLNAEPIWDAESLQRVVVAADAAGLQCALHAIGDRAVRMAIDSLEHAAMVNGTTGRRHRIEHLEYTDADDVGRLAPLGITASMQPVHIDPAIYSNWGAMLGDPRADRGFAWREFLDAGTTLAFGTDTPTAPHEPLHNMYIAATRKSPGDPSLAPHAPHNALPLEEAIVHGTRDSAWASFLHDAVGSLRPGLYADFIVLDRDPFADGPEALLTARVVRTVLGGRTVHMAG